MQHHMHNNKIMTYAEKNVTVVFQDSKHMGINYVCIYTCIILSLKALYRGVNYVNLLFLAATNLRVLLIKMFFLEHLIDTQFQTSNFHRETAFSIIRPEMHEFLAIIIGFIVLSQIHSNTNNISIYPTYTHTELT